MKVKPRFKNHVFPALLSFFFFFSVSIIFLTEVRADDIEFQPGVTQSDFRKLTKELCSALSYKALAPAEPLGLVGFDIGLDITATDINQEKDHWENSTEKDDMFDLLFLPKLYVRKGLPFKIDLGASYGIIPDTNISLLGAEVKYSILEGSTASPAIAFRGTYTQLLGVDQLDLSTYGVDLSVSKGFLNLTPYGGIGAFWVSSEAEDLNAGVDDLDREDMSLIRYFGGVRFAVFMLNVTVEVDYMEVPSYSLRVGMVF